MCNPADFSQRRSDSVPSTADHAKTKRTLHLQPYPKTPIGYFTAKETSPELILDKHSKIDAQKYLVAQVGLENFIRSISTVLDLKLPRKVKFNMNGQGRMESWDDVYLAEKVYTRCLGISKRIYQTHAVSDGRSLLLELPAFQTSNDEHWLSQTQYTHEPSRNVAYFILEEHNERSFSWLPGFDFYVLVFTYYDEEKRVTRVDVQYDQLSFYLHCVGLAQAHASLVEAITPLVVAWARVFHGTGFVNPFTFLLNLLLGPLLIYWYFFS